MRRILFLLTAILMLAACSSTKKSSTRLSYNSKSGGKTYASASSTKSESKTSSSSSLTSISKKLGINVTKKDNVTLYSEAASWIGTPYKYGGTSRKGVDCSGFTYLMYKSVYGKTISRQSAEILTKNCKKISKSELREGDLVFFRTDGKNSKTPNHVGIYLKDKKFVHASSSKGVVVSSLDNDYYVRNWITAGRVVK